MHTRCDALKTTRAIPITKEGISGYEWGCTFSSLKQGDKVSLTFAANCGIAGENYKSAGKLALLPGGTLQYELRYGPQKAETVEQKTLKRCKTSGMP